MTPKGELKNLARAGAQGAGARLHSEIGLGLYSMLWSSLCSMQCRNVLRTPRGQDGAMAGASNPNPRISILEPLTASVQVCW